MCCCLNQFVLVLTIVCSMKSVASLQRASSYCNQGKQKVIYFIRHSTTEMNEYLTKNPWGSANFKDKDLWDTVLSSSGILLAQNIQKRWSKTLESEENAWIKDIDLILSSPLTRAIQTSELLFPTQQSTLKQVHPLLRERVYLSSDIGRPKSVIEKQFPLWDFQFLPQDDSPWWYHINLENIEDYKEWRPPGDYLCAGEPIAIFRDRLKDLRKMLLERPEQRIVVVSHWGVIKGLTGMDFSNCEVRAFTIEDLLEEPFIDES